MGGTGEDAQGEQELVIARDFAAPRGLVFDAYTKPELVRRWLAGPSGWSMVVCEIDLRVGGAYRYVSRRDDGVEMTMRGVFREIARPERLVQLQTFEPAWYPGSELITGVFTEEGGRTTVTSTVRYDSREARDLVMQWPMESGLDEGYGKLEALLAEELARGDAA